MRTESSHRAARRRKSKKLSLEFPQLELETLQLTDGEWVVASVTKPLTEEEARKILIAYRIVQELIAPAEISAPSRV
jgi:hypothetical protein